MNRDARNLPKTITFTRSISLIMGSVLGSGLLILPGLVYRQNGVYSFYSWVAMSLFIIPFVYIFTRIGRDFPSAGGVVSFIHDRIGPKLGDGVTYLIVISLVLLVPVVAIIGANYIGFIAGMDRNAVIPVAMVLLTFSTLVNVYNPVLTLKAQGAGALLLLLFLVALIALAIGKSYPVFLAKLDAAPIGNANSLQAAVSGMTLVFWAYLGWENLSFTTEEFKDVRRVLVKASVASYVIMTLLYLGLSGSVIALLEPSDPLVDRAPLALVTGAVLGRHGSLAAAAIASLVMLMNINAWVWGPSRLVFSSARRGLLPSALGKLGARGTPANALSSLLVPYLVILFIMLSTPGDVITGLISVVNANFLFLYLITIIAFATRYRSALDIAMSVIAFFATVYLFTRFRSYAGLCLAGFVAIQAVMIARRHLAARSITTTKEPLG